MGQFVLYCQNRKCSVIFREKCGRCTEKHYHILYNLAIGEILMIRFNRYPEGKCKCFTLSYDDGHEADRRFVEIVNKYGIRATFHLNSALFGRPNRISADEVCALYEGHEISMHGATHPSLTQIPTPLALQEVAEDRANLEALTGTIIRGMSYPYGAYNDDVISILKNTGVCYSRTVASTHGFIWPENFLAWNPSFHHREDSVNRIRSFMKSMQLGALCYVWGHCYEFRNNDNWDLLEDMCRAATTDAGDEWYQKADTVWLATNIEIYDYITAVRNLIVSMDGKIIYNPSALDVWVEADGEPIKISGGRTVSL